MFGNAKIQPFSSFTINQRVEEEEEEEKEVMRVLRLHTMLKLYGGQRHPKLETFEVLKQRGELMDVSYVSPSDTVIYVSHEWVGTDHPDPDGAQMYHLLLTLERLRNGEISRTDMDAMHSYVFKNNHTTSSDEWKTILQNAFLWYDGLCVPREKRDVAYRSIPAFIERSDFTIILAPGCVHFNKIDSRTQRKKNLCYRTYRLQARCVLEMFSAFLTTQGDAKPMLLVRSGTGTPCWVSPLECQKLAVGTSIFECCELNHTTIRQCRKFFSLKSLDRMIQMRTRGLFKVQHISEARLTMCLRNWWCRELGDQKTYDSLATFKIKLRWNKFVGLDNIPLLCYAVTTDCLNLVQELLEENDDLNVRDYYIIFYFPHSLDLQNTYTGTRTKRWFSVTWITRSFNTPHDSHDGIEI